MHSLCRLYYLSEFAIEGKVRARDPNMTNIMKFVDCPIFQGHLQCIWNRYGAFGEASEALLFRLFAVHAIYRFEFRVSIMNVVRDHLMSYHLDSF